MAMRHAGEAGLRTIGLVNVPGSDRARGRYGDADAPAEIGVASAKAFTAQLTALVSLPSHLPSKGADQRRTS